MASRLAPMSAPFCDRALAEMPLKRVFIAITEHWDERTVTYTKENVNVKLVIVSRSQPQQSEVPVATCFLIISGVKLLVSLLWLYIFRDYQTWCMVSTTALT